MLLTPKNLALRVTNSHYVRVPMEDGENVVTVHISASALRQRAAIDQQNSTNLALLYSLYREQIEAIASAKYAGDHRRYADIVVVAKDLIE